MASPSLTAPVAEAPLAVTGFAARALERFVAIASAVDAPLIVMLVELRVRPAFALRVTVVMLFSPLSVTVAVAHGLVPSVML